MTVYFKDNSQRLIQRDEVVLITRLGITITSKDEFAEEYFTWDRVEKVID